MLVHAPAAQPGAVTMIGGKPLNDVAGLIVDFGKQGFGDPRQTQLMASVAQRLGNFYDKSVTAEQIERQPAMMAGGDGQRDAMRRDEGADRTPPSAVSPEAIIASGNTKKGFQNEANQIAAQVARRAKGL